MLLQGTIQLTVHVKKQNNFFPGFRLLATFYSFFSCLILMCSFPISFQKQFILHLKRLYERNYVCMSRRERKKEIEVAFCLDPTGNSFSSSYHSKRTAHLGCLCDDIK